jgi:hypothetical protein
MRKAWRYFMTDALINQMTWKGQIKVNSKKPKDVKGLESCNLPSVIYSKSLQIYFR